MPDSRMPVGTRPLRIALLTHSVLPRGGVVHALELAEALTARGHAVTVIAPAEPGQAIFRRIGCPVVLVPLPPITGTLVEQVGQRIAGLVAGLPAALAAGAFDLLHVHDSLNGNALAELRARGQVMPPWLRTVHHLDDFSRQPQLAVWQERAWRGADALACVSDTWVRRMATEHGRAVQRLHNGVDLRRFRARPLPTDVAHLADLGLGPDLGPQAPADAPLVLSIGGIESRKNSVRLLQAFARLRATDPAWARARLVVVGGASLLDHSATQTAWRAALQDSGLREGPGEAVLCTGALPDAALPALMRHARLLAMPSLVEGFGLAALEALACGTPVLVSDRAPFTEHLTGCPAVAWCDPLEVDSIAAGLRATARLPRPPVVPAVCLAHGWDASAERHEQWYRATLACLATPTTRKGIPMPAMHYTVRWPDASESVCYSPSLVMHDFFTVGEDYALDEFLRRVRSATTIASERVRAKYGFACSRAADQLDETERRAAAFAGQADAQVRLLAFSDA